jgi:hypothetical protein
MFKKQKPGGPKCRIYHIWVWEVCIWHTSDSGVRRYEYEYIGNRNCVTWLFHSRKYTTVHLGAPGCLEGLGAAIYGHSDLICIARRTSFVIIFDSRTRQC